MDNLIKSENAEANINNSNSARKMDVQKKKQLQEKIYKLPKPALKKVVEFILESNPDTKYTKNLNGYFFNMSYIDDTILLKLYDIVLEFEKTEC